ncbi:hypothetical protein O181_098589 [Austropuccinia psidii MF-1]|uniref:Small-subunit processome Utp12 domain-containing protein n=1 Tax=Austropuccinia psidii MF-1 TaxID=1389203 RepID=A0A9Q3PEN9_9BASI|nr:hypothetical protein [Austropuccinia psidii MF-1]
MTQKSLNPKSKRVKPNKTEILSSSTSSSSGTDEHLEQDISPAEAQESFSDRLKNLNLQNNPSNDQEFSQDENSENEPTNEMKKLRPRVEVSHHGDSNPIMPVGSLAQTLVQALNSDDTKLLETCFFQSNKNSISITLQRLPKPLVHNLIQHLVLCLNRKKRGAGDGSTVPSVRRTKVLIEWVKQVLSIHMSYLLTIPMLSSQLTVLHTSLQKRLNLHSKLLALNGRLELVLNQIDLKREVNYSQRSNSITSGIQQSKSKVKKVTSQNEPYRYVEGQSSASEEEGEPGTSNKDSDSTSQISSEEETDEDEDEEMHEIGSGDEGSVEEVVFGNETDEYSESNDEDEDKMTKGGMKDKEDLLDLEADESGSEVGQDEEEEEEEDDEEDSMDGFIDDGTEESVEETDEE